MSNLTSGLTQGNRTFNSERNKSFKYSIWLPLRRLFFKFKHNNFTLELVRKGFHLRLQWLKSFLCEVKKKIYAFCYLKFVSNVFVLGFSLILGVHDVMYRHVGWFSAQYFNCYLYKHSYLAKFNFTIFCNICVQTLKFGLIHIL